MRKCLLAAVSVIAVVPCVVAQPEPDSRLSTLLQAWQKPTDAHCEFDWIRTDVVFHKEQRGHGEVVLAKADLLRLDWKDDKDRPVNIYWQVGTQARLFFYPGREEFSWQMGDATNQSWMQALFDRPFQRVRLVCCGLKPADVLDRYRLRLVKEDAYYAYVELEPRLPADRADVQLIRVALLKQTGLPRMVQFLEPDGTSLLWDICRFETNQKPAPTADTLSRNLPRGWKQVVISKGDKP